MKVEIGTLAVQFLLWGFLFQFSVLVLCSGFGCCSKTNKIFHSMVQFSFFYSAGATFTIILFYNEEARKKFKLNKIFNITMKLDSYICFTCWTLFGYRCNQLPLIEKLPQWLSGPSLPLSVAAGPLDGYRTRFKWCSDAQWFYSTISIDDINAQSGWSLKTEKFRINNMYTLILLTQYGIYF